MNAHSNQPHLSALLGQVATIVQVKTSSLGLSRLDKEASKSSDANHQARQGTARVSVSRLSGAEERVKAITAKANEARAMVASHTTVWGDSAQRLLANVEMQKVMGLFGVIKAEHDALVSALVADAPRLIAEAEQNLGNYHVAPPSQEEIEGAFSLAFDIAQIPDSANFAASGVTHQLQEQMRRQFEANIEAAYSQATTDALQKVAKPLASLVERMAAYDQRERDKAKGMDAKGGMFRDSVITNIQDVAAVFRSFNLTGDPIMDQVAKELDAFNGIDADDLRNDGQLRESIAKKAEKVLADLADLI